MVVDGKRGDFQPNCRKNDMPRVFLDEAYFSHSWKLHAPDRLGRPWDNPVIVFLNAIHGLDFSPNKSL
jgi:hypothetical protein